MPENDELPQYFEQYWWDSKHHLYGYPPDEHPNFQWIVSLERRFAWLRANCAIRHTASIYLLKEMIQWGGSQNGVLQKFEDRLGEINLYELLTQTIRSLGDPDDAIASALQLPGMGLAYASKLLRFLDPERYGALDSRLRGGLGPEAEVPMIYDGNETSMINGYVAFIRYLDRRKTALQGDRIARPTCKLPSPGNGIWRAADIEMALFAWADRDVEP